MRYNVSLQSCVLIRYVITLCGHEFLHNNCFQVTFRMIKDKTQLAVQGRSNIHQHSRTVIFEQGGVTLTSLQKIVTKFASYLRLYI